MSAEHDPLLKRIEELEAALHHKVMEDLLQREAIHDHAPIGVAIVDSNGIMVYFNQWMRDFPGGVFDQFLGRQYDEEQWGLLHPDGRLLALDELPAKSVFNTGKATDRRKVGINLGNGHIRWMFLKAVPVFTDGQLIAVRVYVEDISDMEIATSQLQSTRIAVQSFIDNLIDVAVLVSTEGRVEMVNKAIEDVLGYPIETYQDPAAIPSLLHPDSLRLFEEFWTYFAKHGRFGEGKILLKWKHANGHYVSLQHQFSNRYDAKGNLVGFMALGRDLTVQLQIQEKLHKSFLYQRALLDTLPDSIFIFSPKGEMLDIPSQTNIRHPLLQKFAKSNTASFGLSRTNILALRRALLCCHESREPQVATFTFQPEGERKEHFEVRISYLDEGQLMCLVREITEMVEAREKLQRALEVEKEVNEELAVRESQLQSTNYALATSEATLQEAQRIGKMGNFSISFPDQTITWSDEVYHLLGLSKGQITPSFSSPTLAISAEEQQKLDGIFAEAALTGASFSFEIRLYVRQALHYFQIRGQVQQEQQESVLIMATLQDITDLKKAQQNLEETTYRLSLAAEAAKLGIWDYDFMRLKMFWDERMKEFYEVGPQDINQDYQQVFEQRLGAEGSAILAAQISEAIKNKTGLNTVFKIHNPSGNERYIHTFTRPVFDANGKIERMIGVNADVTEEMLNRERLKASNEELKKINQELDRFVYSASHDLRAPLTSIIGLLRLSLEEQDIQTVRHYLSLMERSAVRLDNFIQEITHYSRNLRLEVKKEPVDFQALLQNTIEQLSYMEEARQVDCQISLRSLAPFYSDSSRIGVVLSNLVSNGFRYMNPYAEHPMLSIDVQTNEQEAIITVTDNGIGIGEEHLPRIFEMFYRATDRKNGSGLGLYIVREVVEKLQGTIEISSQLSKGTTFTVRLPNLTPAGA